MLCDFYHGASVAMLHMLLLFATLVCITYSTTTMICMKHCWSSVLRIQGSVLQKWRASEIHARPMPMSLIWGVPNSLSGWVCCCSSKEKKLKNVHSSNDETIKDVNKWPRKTELILEQKIEHHTWWTKIVGVCNMNKRNVQVFRGTQKLRKLLQQRKIAH
jgi:hypothetical protein